MKAITLQFSTSLEWQSAIIRRITHSPFSHVDFILDDGSCLGASDPGGVIIRPADYQLFGIRRRATIYTEKADAIIDRAKSQIGKPFDGDALHAFLSPPVEIATRDWKCEDHWFCSELAAWAFEEECFWPYSLIIAKKYISPPDLLLLLNPYIDVEQFWKLIPELKLGQKEK